MSRLRFRTPCARALLGRVRKSAQSGSPCRCEPSSSSAQDVDDSSAAIRSDAARPGVSQHQGRTAAQWWVDVACFAFAVLNALITLRALAADPRVSHPLLLADLAMTAAACAVVWLRRRWPVAVTIVLCALLCVEPSAAGAGLVALFTLAAHRPARVVVILLVPGLACWTFGVYLRPPAPGQPPAVSVITGTLAMFAATGWGMFARSRHQLMQVTRERAQQAAAQAKLREERAQQLTREEVAREMHDVLGHRLSLLSMHSGALEFRPDAPAAEIKRASGVIRESARQALQDLRDVIGVLRAPDTADTRRPSPTLAQLPRLVEESQQPGPGVTLIDRAGAAGTQGKTLTDLVGRTSYRIIQEGLTNARKHAPHARTTVTLTGKPGEGLAIEVRNPMPERGAQQPAPPGSGQGLIGLTERANLAGGRLEHGTTPSGDFRLYAWLPWPEHSTRKRTP
ncbi:histidine kinase [Streptomyces sp. L2]|uniref:sensor histidine kinase n=1 Tax=Streptomyces sp. L2 TaxID=2162665 RepID=UPI001011F04C|nr:histidine kinase [Streptomyces sp. L2]